MKAVFMLSLAGALFCQYSNSAWGVPASKSNCKNRVAAMPNRLIGDSYPSSSPVADSTKFGQVTTLARWFYLFDQVMIDADLTAREQQHSESILTTGLCPGASPAQRVAAVNVLKVLSERYDLAGRRLDGLFHCPEANELCLYYKTYFHEAKKLCDDCVYWRLEQDNLQEGITPPLLMNLLERKRVLASYNGQCAALDQLVRAKWGIGIRVSKDSN